MDRTADEARRTAERVARESYGRLVAYLSARNSLLYTYPSPRDDL